MGKDYISLLVGGLFVAILTQGCSWGIVYDSEGKPIEDVYVVANANCSGGDCADWKFGGSNKHYWTQTEGGIYKFDGHSDADPQLMLSPTGDHGDKIPFIFLASGYDSVTLNIKPDYKIWTYQGKTRYHHQHPNIYMCKTTETDVDGDGICNWAEGFYGTSWFHTDTDEDGKSDFNEIYTDVTESYAVGPPPYSPSYWNNVSVRPNNNCYNYSINRRTDTFAQPGRRTGAMSASMACADVLTAADRDIMGRSSATEACPNNETKVALVVAPGWDYHWYRKDSSGRWSHKPGGTAATDRDNSGNLILNPETANRGVYTNFCGYYCVSSDTRQGRGHENIR